MNNRDGIRQAIMAGRTAYEEAKQGTEAKRTEALNSPRYDWIKEGCSALVLFGYLIGIHQVFS